MRHAVTKELFAYWSRLKASRLVPDRLEIDPSAIRTILADTFIVEMDREFAFPIRFSGTRLNALWLQEQKEKSFLDWWRIEDRRNVLRMLLIVIDGMTPVVGDVWAHSSEGNPLALELLLLPLRHSDRKYSRLLGSLFSSDRLEWIGRIPARRLALAGSRQISAEEEERIFQDHDAPPLSLRSVQSAPRLTVYQGGKL
jgi:hypothetical protein